MKKQLLTVVTMILTLSIHYSVHAANSSEIIDGVSTFLTERSEANLAAIVERRMKNDEQFQCYFPETSKAIKEITLNELFLDKNYWDDQLSNDLEALAFRTAIASIDNKFKITEKSENLLSKYVSAQNYLVLNVNGHSESLGFMAIASRSKPEWVDAQLQFSEIPNQVNQLLIKLKPLTKSCGDKPITKANVDDLIKQLEALKAVLDKLPHKTLKDFEGKIAIDLTTIKDDNFCSSLGLNEKACLSFQYTALEFLKEENLDLNTCTQFDKSQPGCMAIKDKSFEFAKGKKQAEILLKNYVPLLDEILPSVVDNIQAIRNIDVVTVKQEINKRLIAEIKLKAPLLKSAGFDDQAVKDIGTALDNYVQNGKKDILIKLIQDIRIKHQTQDDYKTEILASIDLLLEEKPSDATKAREVLKQLKAHTGLSEAQLYKLTQSIMMLARISDAEDAEAVYAILVDYTLPPVSFALKRDSNKSVFITSYVGGVYQDSRNAQGDNLGAGIFAPVGLEFTSSVKRGGSISLMLSPLDFGYPINLKLSDEEAEVELEEIFAPSITAAYGWKNYPVTWGIGFQQGRTNPLTGEGSNYFLGFIAFDMPLFRIY